MLQRPFVGVFPGAERAWAAIRRARARHVPVRLWSRAPTCGIANLERGTRASAALGEVIDYIESRERMFEGDDEDVSIWAPAEHVVPEVLREIPPPEDLPAPHRAQLWVGGRGQATSLHEDPWPNYNFQLVGRKQFTLFRPDDEAFLYKSRDRTGEFDVNPLEPDLARYPDYEKARPMTFELVAGLFLYLPPGWPHQVVYIDDLVVNLNYWGSSHTSTPRLEHA